ncbi:hypothetical protein NQ318_005829 [Aromia moschata]|uniref:Cytochrome c oxidase subunit 5A, mitochondrial n=1 Tax=Aromia moschata TaxID=1265417 RepID=A0AAV8YQN1_9CUCU|nr:hypothetical protein NQ318_005829 [Aromia moschata]
MKRKIVLKPGQPEKIQIQLSHYKQKYNWDCGISCVLMVLPTKDRLDFLNNFTQICKNEGFNKSTWTIDLCYLLKIYKVKHVFYTITLGVHEGYRGNSFYHHVLTKDENRVKTRFKEAKSVGISVKKSSKSVLDILAHLVNGPLIVLTNARILSCDICKFNKISSELRKCIPWPIPYQGHYIVVCGYDVHVRKVFYRNPSFGDLKFTSRINENVQNNGGTCSIVPEVCSGSIQAQCGVFYEVSSEITIDFKLMSSHSTETDEQFDSRFESFFNRKDIDGWEIRQGMNDLAGHDLVPEPKILIAALKACRRVNDFALAVRILEAVKDKCGSKVNEIYPYIIQELRPTLTELGISTPEELGFDKPELALQSVFDMH